VWIAASLSLVLFRGVVAQTESENQVKPKSPASRASIYDKTADAKAQVAKATGRAKRDNKRILLMFGGDWCGWCHKLHDLFDTNPDVRKILGYEYVLVMVDTEAPNAAELFTSCRAALSAEELQKGVGFPFLAVLDAEGKILKAQRTDPLEEGDHHDPKRVREFLEREKVPPKDAKLAVAEAQSRAAAEHKRVFLTFGAPWCGWCHHLEDWLAQPEVAAIFERDFLPLKIDIERMTGGRDIMSSFRSSESEKSGGIPWYTILDSNGKALASSDGPDGNIGYPFEPREIDQFVAMVQAQAQRIDSGQLEQLRRTLNDAADRIRKAIEKRRAEQSKSS
jgi:thioredoxin-related protein